MLVKVKTNKGVADVAIKDLHLVKIDVELHDTIFSNDVQDFDKLQELIDRNPGVELVGITVDTKLMNSRGIDKVLKDELGLVIKDNKELLEKFTKCYEEDEYSIDDIEGYKQKLKKRIDREISKGKLNPITINMICKFLKNKN